MKRLFTIAGLVIAATATAATLTPISLLNPAGSTSGQVITSTGPSSAPAWGTISLSSLGGTVPVANGGTGATTAANARTGLGLGTAATQNTGTSGATVPLLNGANTWAAAQTFSVRPTFNGATPYDTANLTIGNYQLKAGITDGSNAAAGQIGEYVSSTVVSGSAVALTSGTPANVTSISLSPGDWDVWGTIITTPAAGTTQSLAGGGTSTVSGAIAPPNQTVLPFTAATGAGVSLPVAYSRFLNTNTTTVYLVAYSTFSGGTNGAYGFIAARRRR